MPGELALYFQFLGQLTVLAGGYWLVTEIYRDFKERRNPDAE